MAYTAGSANSIVADWGGSCAECTWATCVTIVLGHHGHIILICLWRSKIVDWSRVACVTLSQLGHEVAIEHRLSHLHLLIASHFVWATVVAAGAKAANPGLIKYLVLISLTVDIGKHVVDSWIICWLEHDSGMRWIHFVDWQWPVSTNYIASSTLLSHPVGHKECLIWFLRSKPVAESKTK